jgi:hypothetical protein
MAPTNNLENRVIDRDATELRGELRDFRKATIASFNATREDITDLRTEMRTGFAMVNERFAKVDEKIDAGFMEMRGTLDGCAAGYQHIVKLLNTIMEQGGE